MGLITVDSKWYNPFYRNPVVLLFRFDLQKKGVQFVYITGETSPQAAWEGMIKNIAGVHYRLTNKQWGELCSSLGIPGIPVYLILNADGSVAYSNLQQGGYPGNEVIQNNVEVALTNK